MKRLLLMIPLALFLTGSSIAQTPAPAPAQSVDITGQWTATFDSPVGTQSYTYDFIAKDGKLTGKIKGNLSDNATDVKDGKVDGRTVTFGETLSFQGMDIAITYTGVIASADEIKFTRNVAEFGSEELVAKRVKK